MLSNFTKARDSPFDIPSGYGGQKLEAKEARNKEARSQ
jgi:hypothetical protein